MTISDNKSDILAEIQFKTTEDDGRNDPIYQGYFPNHGGFHSDHLKGAKHYYEDRDTVFLGDTVVAKLTFIDTEDILKSISINDIFTVQEASHIVGSGKVLEVLNPILVKEPINIS